MTDDKRVFDRGLALRLLEDAKGRQVVTDFAVSQWPRHYSDNHQDFRDAGGDGRFVARLRELVGRTTGDVYAEPGPPGKRPPWRDVVDLKPECRRAYGWDGKTNRKLPSKCPVHCPGVYNAALVAVVDTLVPLADKREADAFAARLAAERKADAKRAADKAKREAAERAAKARRLGTQGVTFAGASCRFKEHGRDVFMVRADLRSAFVDAGGLCLTDAAGATWRPEVKDAAGALAEVLDWRWRGSAEWVGIDDAIQWFRLQLANLEAEAAKRKAGAGDVKAHA